MDINNPGANIIKTISFTYDPMGQRIMKLVNDASGLKYTYYRRDALGNLIATNRNQGSGASDGGNPMAYSLDQYIVYGQI